VLCQSIGQLCPAFKDQKELKNSTRLGVEFPGLVEHAQNGVLDE